jgi:hypothetical protein
MPPGARVLNSGEVLPGTELTAPYFIATRDALDRWKDGKPPTVSVHDCARFVRLIDQAYEHAGFKFGAKGWARSLSSSA